MKISVYSSTTPSNPRLSAPLPVQLLLGIFIILFLLVGCGLQTNERGRQVSLENEPTPAPTAVTPSKPVYEVERGTVIRELTFNGRIAPISETPITPPFAGIIAELLIQKGDNVSEGDIIATFDTSEIEAEIAQLDSELEIAQTQLDNIQSQLNIDRRRAELDLELAQLQLDFALEQAGEEPTPEQTFAIRKQEIAVEVAQLALDEIDQAVDPLLLSNIQQLELQILELNDLIAQAQLIAPASGQITTLNMREGNRVSENETVAILADLTELEVTATLNGGIMGEVAEGIPVQVSPSSRPGDQIGATIRRMPYPFGSGGTSADFEDADETTRISFDNLSQITSYEAGDRVNVSVLLTKLDDVLWLPPSAIRTFNGRNFVVIQDDEGQRRVDVTVGVDGDNRIEIIAGVEPGDVVIGP